ncbi:MAG TPA: N-acetylmuramoyl-L-alanine amidase, partial [Vicinamibacterales bacterium]|nr:N-acetylmuramoyl-L-alanine amidase [Vicinamibacterales bacterium]
MKLRVAAICVLVSALAGASAVEAAAANPRTLYTQALARERALRDASRQPTLAQLRGAISAYETLVSKFPSSGYSDNALWQAANLAFLAFDRFGQQADKRTGVRLLSQMKAEYPASSLIAGARDVLRERERAASSSASLRASTPTSPATAIATVPSPPPAVRLSNVRPRTGDLSALPRFMPPVLTSGMKPVTPATTGPVEPPVVVPAPATLPRSAATTHVSIREVTRTSLPDGMRVTIEMDGEATYYAERLENPRRVFFDLRGARASGALQDASLRFTDDIVREIRLGRHPNATRVVMDMQGAESYSVFTLYEPFRLVVDFKRAATPTPPPAPPLALPTPMRPTPAQETDTAAVPDARPLALRPIAAAPPPSAPAANLDGKFSLARQLGLGISRIVIDAGHGGHDPGARSNGLTEAELTLDVALRLSRLLQKVPGVEVVMTRATDVFIPLEERTAIANREGADLFLSIHANASRNAKARGVETYFLNFASNPEAEAVAARENAGSAQTMHRLPEIVRAIALNNKLDESRDFAEIVQKSMVSRLSTRNKQLRDLGVKQAPFVVLIGAEMPSVLAEMAFVTHKQEGTLLKTGAYRQQIAESLLDAVLRYQQSLKQLR